MSNNLKRKLIGSFATIAMLGLAGCGNSSSNNDQGTSFLAFGFFSDGTGTAGSSGSLLPLFVDVSPTGVDALFETRFIGLENRLTRQFVNVSRVDCDYNIEGSFIDIPSDSTNVAIVLGAAPAAVTGTPGTPGTPPPTTGTTASRSFTEIFVVSPDLFSFLNNNRALLPQLPFRMTASCSATGVTQAGDIITSNKLTHPIQFVDESECCTGTGTVPGFQTGPGTGGTLTPAEVEGNNNTTSVTNDASSQLAEDEGDTFLNDTAFDEE